MKSGYSLSKYIYRNIYYFIFLLILTSANLFAQPALQRTWISENLSYFKIDSTHVFVDFGQSLKAYNYTQNDTVLHVWNTYIADNQKRSRDYYLKIVSLKKDSLVLHPITEDSKMLVRGDSAVVFIDSILLFIPDLKFERIMFSAGGCFGYCPIMKLSFDSSGNIILLGKKYTEPYLGYYEGKLPEKVLDKFLHLLKYSVFDRVPENTGPRIDGAEYTLKIEFNNRTKTIRGNDFPFHLAPLLYFLETIYKNEDVKLRKSSSEYESEFK